MRKRIRLFAFTLTSVLLLAGCNGKTETPAPVESSKSETVSDTDSSEEPGIESENKIEETEELPVPEELSTPEEPSTPEEASEPKTEYWVDTTEIEIEMPGQYELESTITDWNYEVLSTANTTAEVSFSSTTEGCDEGYMQTVITSKNIYRYGDLPADIALCIKFGPVDLYTGTAFEDYSPDDDFATTIRVGERVVFDTHKFTTTVDGTDYDISWYMEGEMDGDSRTEVYYITYPIDYNGIGFLISGGWFSGADIVARADEVGGWPNMRMEDYFEFLSTPYLVDCRN